MNCVFTKFVQENTFSQNCPTLLVPPFSRQGFGVSILTYEFSSRDLLSHSFVRFLHELCVCDIVSCFVLSKWVDGAKFRYKRKFQRHLWAGLFSFLSTDFSCDLLRHSFLRFFTKFCVYALVLVFLCVGGRDKAELS